MTMVRAKLPATLIIEKINTSNCAFDTFPSVLEEMRHRGVPEEVVSAMVQAPRGRRTGQRIPSNPSLISPTDGPPAETKPVENLETDASTKRAKSQQETASSGDAVLTNADIVKMLRSGLSANVVTATVKGSTGNYDTSPNALIVLKNAGATDTLILSLIEAARPSAKKNASRRITDELTASRVGGNWPLRNRGVAMLSCVLRSNEPLL